MSVIGRESEGGKISGYNDVTDTKREWSLKETAPSRILSRVAKRLGKKRCNS